MKQYRIEIVETLNRVIEINAESETDALDIVQDRYYNSEYVLDANDMISPVEFNVLEDD